ncbi:sensor histidine kinase [Haloferula chungangensis]|uniref:Sensor histidine kinase n=1 Tax=Haloferula chungangensis TaxID=1048331 RepID=A0ABW2L8H6_9BACT
MSLVRNRWISFLIAALLSHNDVGAGQEGDLGTHSLQALEKRLGEIDAELSHLAHDSLRGGVGSIGYRSKPHPTPSAEEWVEISFDRAYPIDEVILVPTLWRDSNEGFQADGFPEGFRIIAGSGSREEGVVIASYDGTDHLLPRIAPVVVPIDGFTASWLRVEASQLTRRAFDDSFIFQLSELMVFSGSRNVALRRPARSFSNHGRDLSHAWDLQFLVDGHIPYLMAAAQGEPSVSYIASVQKHSALIVDLGEVVPLSGISLHAVDQSDTVPQAYSGNLGIPPKLLIEGATKPDFSDAVVLLSEDLGEFTDTSPINMWRLSDPLCRYVRISTPDEATRARFGFAEIEIFSGDRNVALHRSVVPNVQPVQEVEGTKRFLSSLTDGRNLYGEILSIREWMNQLARRHDLETERPLIVAELNRRYARQKRNLQIMSWVAALLAVGVAFIILIDRMLRMRQTAKMRERFAADLHDELGANIHTIGLLGDLARDANSREELIELLDRSRMFTERSGFIIRNWAKRLEARGLCEDLVNDMKVASASLLADLDHEFSIEGEEHLEKLSPRKRIYIFLFYKECLSNILRHSGATSVVTRLKSTRSDLTLEVSDNGIGLEGEVPRSLKRRARLLRANAWNEKSTDSGTCITLHLRIPRLLGFP